VASPESLVFVRRVYCAECGENVVSLERVVFSTELTSGGNALILLEPRLGTLGQPPTLLSIARPGRRMITLMQTLGYCARSGRRKLPIVPWARAACAGPPRAARVQLRVQLRVMAQTAGLKRLAQRRRCPSRPARLHRMGLCLWLMKDPDMTVLTVRDRLSGAVTDSNARTTVREQSFKSARNAARRLVHGNQ